MILSAEKKSLLWQNYFGVPIRNDQLSIALAGNPNVGKSTIFNALTGLHQHTGNWPGKTVDNAHGSYQYQKKPFLIVDLPGTYSLLAHTVEEQIARDFLCFANPDVTVVVLDATSLERNLNLALQVFEITPNVIVCLNLMDEAKKKNLVIDVPSLERELGVPVVATAARQGIGLTELREKILQVATGLLQPIPRQIKYSSDIESALKELLPLVENIPNSTLSPRWIALRLLDGDQNFLESLSNFLDIDHVSFQDWEESKCAQ
ncbi:FeoB small GTPase domain-containing protein [Desulfosporosinus meridiei]|uniref:Fe2+ transport system protein B n=1 Tax=Desulfosporosinus meridiei (strain ATCC BAA-275 / DSM 13257 / KCTC 12902 / NCIMB 13706 / S10) TaxID=768704 RepID=J7IVQ8_DESMD|nr:FeoB small GTPase domain-containing protein [Desulfosporosinus meridiei]AFQ42781.1 Fe2+ transport system protein B [Desulfosporosinus meridiei DSM 13257]